MVLLLFTLFLCILFPSAYACGAGGIGGPTSGALIALCVVFLPVIIPVAAVGGGSYLAYTGIKKGANAIKDSKKKQRNKKRNSDIIKTQMSRAVKLVGRDKFQDHIEKLYARTKEDHFLRPSFELGVALFLNRDLLGADKYLTTVIDTYAIVPYMAHAYFVRGLVNQYLFAFKQAAKDFQEAIRLFGRGDATPAFREMNLDGADPSSIPRLTAFDAHNSYGFACALQALFAEEDNKEKERLLDLAINEYTIALDGVEIKQGMWFHNRGVARYFRTYYQSSPTPESTHADLELALADFVNAINSGNFGTAADGLAMAAQTCARLKRAEDEITAYIEQAYEADPKVFMVDVKDELELSIPWPLPRHEYPFKRSPHQFEKVHFATPTWCNHCMGFIQNPVGKQGYECTRCKYHVHSKCFPQVKAKSCWSEEMEGATSGQDTVASTHVHHFKAVHFGKPTWCDHCKKFVSNPIGKQGYKCTDCKLEIHKECVDDVKPNLIDD